MQRIRLKTFQCLFRQEIAYHDRPENSPSAISVRLSSDASDIEQIVGVRLGLIGEVLVTGQFVAGQFVADDWSRTIRRMDNSLQDISSQDNSSHI